MRQIRNHFLFLTSKLLFSESLIHSMKPTFVWCIFYYCCIRSIGSCARCRCWWWRNLTWIYDQLGQLYSISIVSFLTSIFNQAAARWIQKQAMRSGGYLTQNEVSRILEETIRWLGVFIHNKITTFSSLNSMPSERAHEVLRTREYSFTTDKFKRILLLFSGSDWIWPKRISNKQDF